MQNLPSSKQESTGKAARRDATEQYDSLSVDQTKSMVTPDAFAVDPRLYGLPLAMPMRRGWAILIDSALIGLLTQQSAALLVIVLSATFFRAGRDTQDKGSGRWLRTKKLLRTLGLVLMVIVGYSLLSGIADRYLPGAQVQQNEPAKPAIGNSGSRADEASLTDWVMGFVEKDLGLGFGWAALYFTVFTAWWGGQTPGKRLMGVRVIRLDGKPLSLWNAFERYGGYGAGFATGLLGFVQIYWDPNRQAIHDKISATVVIKGEVVALDAEGCGEQ